tara:strand:- start:680 stop:985 length:306 start_codon:yes stop_codon:yes gene_type:complete
MIPTFADAVTSLAPKAGFAFRDGVIEKWDINDTKIPQPTEEAIQSKLAELQAAYDAQAYARSRQAEYPPLAEQLDHIYHNGVASWKANMVKPVKDKYPKPG